jgi:hypothetical protein
VTATYNRHVEAERGTAGGLPYFVGRFAGQCLEAVESGVEYRMVWMVKPSDMWFDEIR